MKTRTPGTTKLEFRCIKGGHTHELGLELIGIGVPSILGGSFSRISRQN